MTKPTDHNPSGQPVNRDENKVRQWQTPVCGEDGWAVKIKSHVEKYYGSVSSVIRETESEEIHVNVHHIKPNPLRNCHTLFTTGMSFMPMNMPAGAEDHRFMELMLCLPPEWPVNKQAFQNPAYYWPVKWLKQLARFPHENKTWMGYGRVFPNGDPPKPLSDRTEMNGVIVLPPVNVTPGFLELRMDEQRMVRFYSVIPLYQEELDYKLKYGTDALTNKFHQRGVSELVQLKRKNTCKSSLLSFLQRE